MEWIGEWISEVLPGIVAAWAVIEHLRRLYSEARLREAEREIRRLRGVSEQMGPWLRG